VQSTSSALFASASYGKSGSSSSGGGGGKAKKSSKVQCFYCKRTGHFNRDCHKLKKDVADGKVDKVGRSKQGGGNAEAATASIDAFTVETDGERFLP
jgi:hypothetical protein